ncbi:MAG TPA: hypothetical protein DCQ98_19220 [Planctomycetaceae bacterium]|nr:hypothetical protein [Planctomycetaceae bacterium]
MGGSSNEYRAAFRKKVLVSLEAQSDLVDGIAFYDANGSDVGDYFRHAILADLQSLSIFGGVHAKRFGFHCMPAKRFPFAIYYEVALGEVRVVAVLDERRDPNWIEARLLRR